MYMKNVFAKKKDKPVFVELRYIYDWTCWNIKRQENDVILLIETVKLDKYTCIWWVSHWNVLQDIELHCFSRSWPYLTIFRSCIYSLFFATTIFLQMLEIPQVYNNICVTSNAKKTFFPVWCIIAREGACLIMRNKEQRSEWEMLSNINSFQIEKEMKKNSICMHAWKGRAPTMILYRPTYHTGETCTL